MQTSGIDGTILTNMNWGNAVEDKTYGMKRKTIKRVIESKLDEWMKTLPEHIRTQVRGHIIVTGGCIASMLLGESIKDFDLYCDNPDVAQTLAHHYVEVFNRDRDRVTNARTKKPYVSVDTHITAAGVDKRVAIYVKSAGIASESDDMRNYRYFEGDPADSEGAAEYVDAAMKAKIAGVVENKPKYRPVFLSQNAITLSDKIQIVIRFTGDPNKIHENYDYVHATNYYWTGDKQLVLRPKALELLLSRTLKYQGSLYPVCSLFRMRKFMERGWRISAGEITKMAMQISELDLHDINVLKEQLIGVDAAYFHELLRLLNDAGEDGQVKSIDSTYVIQLIDKLSDDF